MFINWQKTKAMIKSATELQFLLLNGSLVEIVDNFKLLGCTIDNKLNFEIHFRLLKKTILYKLYSIKNIYFILTSIRLSEQCAFAACSIK